MNSLAIAFLSVVVAVPCSAQTEGQSALKRFEEWKRQPANADLSFGQALTNYRKQLVAHGASDVAADRTIRRIVAYDEATLYNRIYAATPEFNTKPNQLLVDATRDVKPGIALDVNMGQGRNTVFLASRGWNVTGFDVAEVGLQKAQEQATTSGLKITTVHASDDEFEFGRERWDLIAIIYALEKRSARRVRDALKPGGLVVIEAGVTDEQQSPMGYRPGELRSLFEGFQILKYEETTGKYDWGPETIRLVRLIARKT